MLMVPSNGRTGGISHPSPEGQEAVIRQAYENAGGLDPNLTGYFECVRIYCHLSSKPITKSIFHSTVLALLSVIHWKYPQLDGSSLCIGRRTDFLSVLYVHFPRIL